MSYNDSGSSSAAASITRGAEASARTEWVEYSELDAPYYTTLLTIFSTLSTLVSQPLNVIMTRQQCGISSSTVSAQGKSNSVATSMISELRRTYATIGFRGLFRGFLPIAVLGIPSHVIYFIVQESSRELLQKGMKGHVATANNNITNKSTSSYQSSLIDMAQSSISSVLANGASLAPYVPAEVISTRLIIQNRKDIGMTAMYKKILNEEGWKGLMKGLGPSMVVGVVFSTQWWASYSILRRELSRNAIIAANPVILDATTGLLAGSIATAVTHPFDTVKTRIMMGAAASGLGARTSMLGVAQHIIRKEGGASLWRGLRASVYSSAFNSTAFAVMYEAIKRTATKE